MATYVYVGGSNAFIPSHPSYQFLSYGQRVELPDDLAEVCKRGRISILPAAEFDKLGHTPEEIQQFGKFANIGRATPAFLAKRKAAWIAVQTGKPVGQQTT